MPLLKVRSILPERPIDEEEIQIKVKEPKAVKESKVKAPKAPKPIKVKAEKVVQPKLFAHLSLDEKKNKSVELGVSILLAGKALKKMQKEALKLTAEIQEESGQKH